MIEYWTVMSGANFVQAGTFIFVDAVFATSPAQRATNGKPLIYYVVCLSA